MMLPILNQAALFLEDAIEIESTTSAVEELKTWLDAILNRPLFIIGGTSITIGLIIALILRYLYKKFGTGKLVKTQALAIKKLEAENEIERNRNAELETRVQTLEAKTNIITKNSDNKKIRDAYYIKIEPVKAEYQTKIPTALNNRKKKFKIKVKKQKEEVVSKSLASISDTAVSALNEVINNGK